jgi:rSAM/selenodomain-associated transferase 1
MTKVPMMGKVKSRLGAEIGEKHAYMLYRCFLLDMVELLSELGEDYIIYYSPEHAIEILNSIIGQDMRYIYQIGENLGERLYNGLEKVRELGYRFGFALASDVPNLSLEYLKEAIESMKKHHLVIGPSFDGGYNLIGYNLKINRPEFYNGIKWGSNLVYDETIKRLDQIDKHVLPLWRDIDNISDLRKNQLNHKSHTYKYLKKNKLL